MIDVKVGAQPALGRVVTCRRTGAGHARRHDHVADWAEFDTLEVFANATPDAADADDTDARAAQVLDGRPLATLAAEGSVRDRLARRRVDDRQPRDAAGRRRLPPLRGHRHSHARRGRHRDARRRDRHRRVARVPRRAATAEFSRSCSRATRVSDTDDARAAQRRHRQRSVRLSTGTACPRPRSPHLCSWTSTAVAIGRRLRPSQADLVPRAIKDKGTAWISRSGTS